MGTFQIRTLFASAIAIAACAACSNGSVDIGEDDPVTAKSGLAAYAGTWDGYVEAYNFRDDNDDRVRLVIDEEGLGSLRFGERDLYALPTDQNALWPIADGTDVSLYMTGCPPYTGFEHRLVGSIVESERIRTASSMAAVFEHYCAIQNPTYPYALTRQYPTDPIVVGYSKTPVTLAFTGWESAEAVQANEAASLAAAEAGLPYETKGCIIEFYDVAPTTVEELSTNSTRTLSTCIFPDPRPFSMASLPPDICSRGPDGTYQLAIPVEQQLDIKLDGALENDGDSLVGSLTIPIGFVYKESEGWIPADAVVRTVRLTRVN